MVLKKRAQITMESLLLYGVAILIVLVGVAALMYFGVLDLGKLLPERCNMEGSGLFKCEEWKVSKDTATGAGAVEIVLVNKANKGIVFDSGSFVSTDGFASNCDTMTAVPTTALVLPGNTIHLTFDCGSIAVDNGDRIKGQIFLNHKYQGGTLDQQTVGELQTTVQ